MFRFAVKFILSFSVFFGYCYFIPFYVLYTQNWEKEIAQVLEFQLHTCFKECKRLYFRGVLKLHMIFFKQMPKTVSANKFCPAWKQNSAT